MMKQEADLNSEKQIYLTCEKYYIFELLIFAAGMMGAYTFNLRGGVFCNAQTANVVLMALAFGKGEIAKGVYYLIPISAYIAGAAISEILPRRVRKIHFLPRVMSAVTTDIIGKSRKIKARYPDRKERGLKSDYT